MGDLEDVRDRIRAIFSEKLHVDPPSAEVDLLEAGYLDSLMLVSLLLHLEEGFGMKIEFETLDIEHFKSVARIADFIAVANGRGGG